MLKNLSSAAVVIGSLRVRYWSDCIDVHTGLHLFVGMQQFQIFLRRGPYDIFTGHYSSPIFLKKKFHE